VLYSLITGEMTVGEWRDCMGRGALPLFIAVGIGLAVAACGPRGKAPLKTRSGNILPERIDGAGWVRAAEVEHFAGDSLFEYIDGAAEMYHKYDFIEVTVGKYLKNDNTITADIYSFRNADRAFGMYTTLRPDDADTVSLGAEGFLFGANLVFVKGAHLLNVYTYDDFDGAEPALRQVAAALETGLSGTPEKPHMFSLFPGRGRVPFSEKIFAEGFLGRGFLTDVYTVDYDVGDGRIRLFMAPDPGGDKIGRWLEAVGVEPNAVPGWKGEVFEEAKSLQFVHDYHGEVVAGWRDGKLIGAVGRVASYRGAFTGWVRSLD